MKCQICKKSFPNRFYAPLFVNGSILKVDPECARKEVNTIHGLPKNTPFRGEKARELNEDFLKWRKRAQK